MNKVPETVSELYEMQKVLDAHIIEQKKLEGQDLLPNTVLALQVEIGELANEWRGFKHWSELQEPKQGYSAKIDCDKCNGKGFWFDGQIVTCTECEGSGKVTNPLLEEYVDCLHFFLSIALQLKLSANDLYVANDYLEQEDTSILFTELLHNVGLIIGQRFLIDPNKADQAINHFRAAMFIFANLGEQRLGFSWQQIAAAYVEKNKINHERQANGY